MRHCERNAPKKRSVLLRPVPLAHSSLLPLTTPIKNKTHAPQDLPQPASPYQSSSSSFFPPPPLIALCLALSASANPPAKLPPPILLGVTLPLSPPDGVVKLTALSLAGVGGGRGFLPPAAGLFAGGAGGVGLDLAAVGEGLWVACFEVRVGSWKPLVTAEWVLGT